MNDRIVLHTAENHRLGGRVTYGILDETHTFAAPSRLETIQSRLAELEAELADLRRFGDDVYDEGTVLTFKADFGSTRTYSYAAIKAAGRWHVTGGRAVQNATWAQLVEFMRGAKVRKVRRVTGTARVV